MDMFYKTGVLNSERQINLANTNMIYFIVPQIENQKILSQITSDGVTDPLRGKKIKAY